MAINIKFDLIGNIEPPTIILANRNGNKLGQLDVNANSIVLSDKLNDASEFTFSLNKYVDGKLTHLWDKLVDFKLIYCKEWDCWFEAKVELDESTETVKTVFCTQLGQAELSQIMLYNIEINTEADIEREDYKTSILYDEKNPESSILHRLLEKAPHYSIFYVDESIQRIQRHFSFDGTSIYDAFNEIGEEIGCLFVYHSSSDENGMPNRIISVYDLEQNCNNKECKHRGEFTDKCPKCGSTDITYGYGEDTTIFVTSDELATEGIQLTTDTDAVKNCFKLEAGDDLMTATIRNCNPNGTDYIWYFSDALKEDMTDELVERLESYDEKYKEYYNDKEYSLNESLVSKYNELVAKYKEYYDTKSVCLDCDTEGYFEEQCSNPNCNSKNILIGKSLQTIPTTITGYSALMNAYYNTIDLLLYLESSLMPNVAMSDTDAKEQASLLTSSSLSPVAVNVEKVENISLETANSAVLSMAKVLVRPTYKVEIKDGSSSLSGNKVWNGELIVTNYSDENDTATSGNISVAVNNEAETFIKQKIEKALKKENTDDLSISGLFDDDKYNYDAFCAELKKYALKPLKSFYDACETCLSILMEQGAGDENEKPDLYSRLYEPYFKKSDAIAKEIKLRENEIAIIEGVYDKSDEENIKLTTDGLQTDIENRQKEIQEELDFENYLGEDLWLEFCSYRREDKYSNSNYISDGLNNAELFKNANEFIEVAENEIFKSAELQYSISATLNNLLAMPKFAPLVDKFKSGNWIRVQIDGKVYRLRLIEYEIDYGDFNTISVEFSDVTKIRNGTTDVQNVLSQASAMASSYDSVQRQAKKGDVARGTIDQWLVDGLNSANVQIKSNDSEEVVITKNGLLARSYSDITGEYSPEQFKITHNIMAYTDDNWQTVSAALGKHQYQKWKDGQWIEDVDYGLSSKFVTAGYISGSQIISGEIISENYKHNESGTYINLKKGDFEFAGGKILYDVDRNNVILKGVTIQWDGEDAVNPPSIENVTGLSEEIEKINIVHDALSPTTIDDKSVVSPLIVGGYLNIKNDTNNTGVVIDPNGLVNDEYVFRVYNNNGTTIGLDVNGNAEFSGTINGSDIIGDNSLFIGEAIKDGSTYKKNYEKDYAEITKDGELICTNVHIKGGVFKASNKEDGTIHTWISEDGVLHTNEADINGMITAISGKIGGFHIQPDEIIDGVVQPCGWLYSGEIQEGQEESASVQIGDDKSIFLSATDMSGTIGTIDTQYFDNDNWRMTIGSNFGVTSDGSLYAVNGIFSDCTMNYCTIMDGALYFGDPDGEVGAWISTDDYILKARGANIDGTITSVDGWIGNWKITTDGIESDAVQLYSSNILSYPSIVDVESKSYSRIVVGGNGEGVLTQAETFTAEDNSLNRAISNSYDFVPSVPFTEIYTDTIKVSLVMPTTSDAALQSVKINEEKGFIRVSYTGGGVFAVQYDYSKYKYKTTPFCVLADGSLYASAVDITGNISATSGKIGNLEITGGGFGYSVGDKRQYFLNEYGLTFEKSNASLTIGDLRIGYDSVAQSTVMETSGRLAIVGENGTKIELMSETEGDAISPSITLHYQAKKFYAESTYADIWISSSTKLLYPVTINVEWQNGYKSYNGIIPLTINAESNTSSKVEIKFTSTSHNRAIRFRHNNSAWTNFVGANGDTTAYSFDNFASFSQTQSPENICLTGNLLPSIHSKNDDSPGYNLGSGAKRWNTVFARNGAIQTSDRNKKNTIQSLSDAHSYIFDSLKPVSYKFNVNNNNRTHTGFIAQDVKEAIENAGLTTQDFAAYCEWEENDGEISCGLRYSEFVALCVDEIQKLKKRVAELENQ